MTYIDDLALEVQRRIPSDLLPDEDTKLLMRLYALLALVKGAEVTRSDVHDAWSVWKLQTDAEHRSLKPFDSLDEETQASDEPFAQAIREVAWLVQAEQT